MNPTVATYFFKVPVFFLECSLPHQGGKDIFPW